MMREALVGYSQANRDLTRQDIALSWAQAQYFAPWATISEYSSGTKDFTFKALLPPSGEYDLTPITVTIAEKNGVLDQNVGVLL
jgi:hypothetical protein